MDIIYLYIYYINFNLMIFMRDLENKIPISHSFTQNQKEEDLLKENSCLRPYKLEKDGQNPLKKWQYPKI